MAENLEDKTTSYESWMREEGVPVVEGYGVAVADISLGPWPRKGGRGAFVQLRGMEGFSSASRREAL